jgi:hypothetical protein
LAKTVGVIRKIGWPSVHPADDEPAVEPEAPVTTIGQLAFLIQYLKQGGLFERWVAGCPLHLTGPNAPAKRDVLGTVPLSVLAGYWRYAHTAMLRGNGVNAPLLGNDQGGQRGRGAPPARQDGGGVA